MKIFSGVWRKVTLIMFGLYIVLSVYFKRTLALRYTIYCNIHMLVNVDIPVTSLDLKQTVQVDKDLIIRAYYAGHVCF